MTNQERIIQRIKKLNAHAQSAKRLGSLEEYQAFALKVQELLLEYNLNLQQVEQTECEKEEEALLKEYGTSDKVSFRCSQAGNAWRLELIVALAHANLCRELIQSEAKTVKVYGRLENIEVVIWLYNFISTQLMRLAKQAYRVSNRRYDLLQYRYIRIWLLGAVDGVGMVLEQKRESNTEQGLMLYNDKALESYVKAAKIVIEGTYGTNTEVADLEVYWRGYKQGKQVVVNERRLYGDEQGVQGGGGEDERMARISTNQKRRK